MILVTTLSDSVSYPAAAIAASFRRRWQIKLNFDDIKTTPCMNHLARRSEDMALRMVNMRITLSVRKCSRPPPSGKASTG